MRGARAAASRRVNAHGQTLPAVSATVTRLPPVALPSRTLRALGQKASSMSFSSSPGRRRSSACSTICGMRGERFVLDVNNAIEKLAESQTHPGDRTGFVPRYTEGDLFALKRVYRNLLMNAFQTIGSRGRVAIQMLLEKKHSVIGRRVGHPTRVPQGHLRGLPDDQAQGPQLGHCKEGRRAAPGHHLGHKRGEHGHHVHQLAQAPTLAGPHRLTAARRTHEGPAPADTGPMKGGTPPTSSWAGRNP